MHVCLRGRARVCVCVRVLGGSQVDQQINAIKGATYNAVVWAVAAEADASHTCTFEPGAAPAARWPAFCLCGRASPRLCRCVTDGRGRAAWFVCYSTNGT